MNSALRQEWKVRLKDNVSFYAEQHEKARRTRIAGSIAGWGLLAASPVVVALQESPINSGASGLTALVVGAAFLGLSESYSNQTQHCSHRLAAEHTHLDALTDDDKPESRFSGLDFPVGDTSPSIANLDE